MDDELERRTLAAEDALWWYQGRRRVVMDSVQRAIAEVVAPRFLDAGCGGGATLTALAPLGACTGLEPSPPAREKALGRGVAAVVDGSIERLPFADASFDIALALDVIEHLDDDGPALRELHRVVVGGGSCIVTVPAHPRLWSRHDELNHHRRRYTRRSLRAAAAGAGWEVARVTHFTTLLLPVATLARLVSRSDGLDIPPAPVNAALRATIVAEAALIRRGVRFPFGLSLLAELRRP